MSLILYAMMNLDSKFLGDTFTSVSFILFFFLIPKAFTWISQCFLKSSEKVTIRGLQRLLFALVMVFKLRFS